MLFSLIGCLWITDAEINSKVGTGDANTYTNERTKDITTNNDTNSDTDTAPGDSTTRAPCAQVDNWPDSTLVAGDARLCCPGCVGQLCVYGCGKLTVESVCTNNYGVDDAVYNHSISVMSNKNDGILSSPDAGINVVVMWFFPTDGNIWTCDFTVSDVDNIGVPVALTLEIDNRN